MAGSCDDQAVMLVIVLGRGRWVFGDRLPLLVLVVVRSVIPLCYS